MLFPTLMNIFGSLVVSVTLGVLGLCAIVLSSPYDIPTYVPDALVLLCEHSHDPDLIQVRLFQSSFMPGYVNFCV